MRRPRWDALSAGSLAVWVVTLLGYKRTNDAINDHVRAGQRQYVDLPHSGVTGTHKMTVLSQAGDHTARPGRSEDDIADCYPVTRRAERDGPVAGWREPMRSKVPEPPRRRESVRTYIPAGGVESLDTLW